MSEVKETPVGETGEKGRMGMLSPKTTTSNAVVKVRNESPANGPILSEIVSALNGRGSDGKFMCQCPAHDDRIPSLSVEERDGKILLKCFAGCTNDAVIAAMKSRGLWPERKVQRPLLKPQVKRAEYIYCDSAGSPALKVCREDQPGGGKKIFQQKYEGGIWIPGGFKGELRPYLHALWQDHLNRRIFLVEGEKCADALIKKGFLATTTPGGSKNWRSSFAQYFSDRVVTIVPDCDRPGLEYAAAAFRDILPLAKSVSVIELPGLSDGEDIFDFFASGKKAEDLKALVSNPPAASNALKALLAEPNHLEQTPSKAENHAISDSDESRFSEGYVVNDSGVFEVSDDGDLKKISSKIVVSAALRDQRSQSWSRRLVITDPDGKEHEWIMPMALLAGDGNAIIEKLLDNGALLEPGIRNKAKLLQYLQTAPLVKSRCTKRIGWNDDVFVFPDVSYQPQGREPIHFLNEGGVDHRYFQSGSLDDWKTNVARLCQGSSRLVFGLSIAFAAPLLELLGEESFGVNLFGTSSRGKTTLLTVAGSVFGGARYVRSWRATGNGLESIAALHNSMLLPLDEMGQVDPKEAGEIAYMLGNGSGKIRGTRTGDTRNPHSWRLIYLSSGELTLRDHMISGGKRSKTGQEIRLLDVPIVGDEDESNPVLHGFSSAAALADHLKEASQKFYGTAGRIFISSLIENRDKALPQVTALINRFRQEVSSGSQAGQISRVTKKFGLIGAAGELAADLGILPFAEEECLKAARSCFKAWHEGWGAGDREASGAIDQVIDFLSVHGEGRFVEIDSSGNRTDGRDNVLNKAGYRQVSRDVAGNSRIMSWWITPSGFKEMIRGYNRHAAIQGLIEKGILIPGTDKSASQRRDPMTGDNQRFYVLNSKAMGESDESI